MFIGHKNELDLLQEMYASDTFECLVLYGRRSVGKTALINEFVKNKRVIYFTGTDTTAQESLENLLKQELREPAMYNAIIRAVANGKSKMSDLTIYSVADGMFRFWYLTVPPQNMLIQRGLSEYAFQNIKPSLETFMGKVFEQICMEYLWKEYPTLPVLFTEIGSWWGADPIGKKTEEIDIVAGNKEAAIFCECKWRNREVTKDVLETLIKRSLLVNIPERYYMIFSKTGFTSGCREAAREKQIRLVTFSEMNLS